MAIDTRQKRQSSGFDVPGLMLNPFPFGVVTASDRIQISDQYTGIAPQIPLVPPNTTLWTQQRSAPSGWSSTKDLSSSWRREQDSSGRFKRESDNTGSWTKEVDPNGNFVPEGEVFPKDEF